MGNKTGEILKQVKQNNEQSIFQTNVFANVQQIVDWKLAYYIYSFLIGRSNKLPHYEYINKVVNEYDDLYANNSNVMNDKAISIGAGIIVRFNDGILTVESEEPITNATNRYDFISDSEYRAYTRTIQVVDGDSRATVVGIDVKEMPRYDEKRIEYLQKHLKGYMESYTKTPKIK